LRRQWIHVFLAALTILGGLAPLTPAESAGLLTGKTICLDPGHGGADPGAYYAPLDLSEADINLDVAYRLAALLQAAGARVVMTRTGDQGLTEAERAAFCNRAQANILVSVHTNSFTDPAPNGVLTFYGKRSAAEDRRLAQALHDAMAPVLQANAPSPATFIDYGVRRYGAGVLRRSAMPAALLEPAFMSNPAEAALLATPITTAPGSGVFTAGCQADSYRRGQIAQSAYRGILAYFTGISKEARAIPTEPAT